MYPASTWFLGQPSVCRKYRGLWSDMSRTSAVVGELEGDVELELPERGHHSLQLVLRLGADAQLVALDAHLHLGMGGADPLVEGAGEVVGDAAPPLDHLA